jgi:ATP-dependent DNA helicase RecG
MKLDELQYILRQGEGTTIEFKESVVKVPKSLYETIVSFSNTDGGTIVLGADPSALSNLSIF